MRKLLLLAIPCLMANMTYAGFNGLTTHSRANCINNETISWDMTAYHKLRNYAVHYDTIKKDQHRMQEKDYKLTWRDATVHWGEGFRRKWLVSGYHYELDCTGRGRLIDRERVDGCAIYDGWWDTKKEDEPQKKDPCKIIYSPYAKVLINFKERAKKQYMEFRNNNNPYSTHLRISPDEIKHTFVFKPIKLKDKTDIGFAPVGTWSKGWTGIKEFFSSPSLGICSYEVNSHGRILDTPLGEIVPWEAGNQESGYLTKLLWQDKDFVYDFECATKTRRPVKDKMIALVS